MRLAPIRPALTASYAVLLAAASACAASAQQTVRDDRAAAAEALEARLTQMRELALARDLGDYGRTHADPLALLAAARILLDVGWTLLDAAPIEGGRAWTPADQAAIDPAALVQQARSLAGDNQRILEIAVLLAARARATPRGAEGGVKTRGGNLAPRAAHRYDLVFLGEQPAAVFIAAPPGGALECAIYDEEGRRVASDSAGGNDCLITWWPDRRARFRIEVRNVRTSKSQYLLMTN